MADDPVKLASRWKPRPSAIRCVRASGAVEQYAVAAGRRAWGALRRVLPIEGPDPAIELTGLLVHGDQADIVGRWQSPAAIAAAALRTPAETQLEDDDLDEVPDDNAQMFRWLAREFRSIYADQAKGYQAALAAVTDALRVIQREVLHPPKAEGSDDEDNDGSAKLLGLLQHAIALHAVERAPSSEPRRRPRPGQPRNGIYPDPDAPPTETAAP
jgi:hypothetical protein